MKNLFLLHSFFVLVATLTVSGCVSTGPQEPAQPVSVQGPTQEKEAILHEQAPEPSPSEQETPSPQDPVFQSPAPTDTNTTALTSHHHHHHFSLKKCGWGMAFGGKAGLLTFGAASIVSGFKMPWFKTWQLKNKVKAGAAVTALGTLGLGVLGCYLGGKHWR